MDLNDFTELQKVMNLFQNQVKAIDSLWAYYSSATLAVLGFTIAYKRAQRSLTETLVIIIGYLVFSVGNLEAIRQAQSTLFALAPLVNKVGSPFDFEVSAFDVKMVTLFHCAVTSAVILSICATYFLSGKQTQKSKHHVFRQNRLAKRRASHN